MAADLCEPVGLAWTVHVDSVLDREDPTLVASIARELVNSAVKHAGASRVDIGVHCATAGSRLEVRDDGRGFCDTGPAERNHFGLVLVENRARAAGGGLEIGPAAGGGAVVAVRLGGFA